ncbi:hypothetical protein K439DRAFT_1615249 [Ramaria rubella]|nr:hypothetical protein K439DRAFT_1615249 [Ramaria rubella]
MPNGLSDMFQTNWLAIMSQQVAESAARRPKIAEARQCKAIKQPPQSKNVPPARNTLKQKSVVLDSDDKASAIPRSRAWSEDHDDTFAQLEQDEAEMDPDAAAEEGELGHKASINDSVVWLGLTCPDQIPPSLLPFFSFYLLMLNRPLHTLMQNLHLPTTANDHSKLCRTVAQPPLEIPFVPFFALTPYAPFPFYETFITNTAATDSTTLSDSSAASSDSSQYTHPVTQVTPASAHPRKNKVKAGDYADEFHSTIILACKYYQVILCTEDAFPVEIDADHFARQAWQLACREHEVDYEADRGVYTVIKYCGSQVCGEVKRNLRPLVTSHLGFQASAHASNIDDTKAYVSHLKSTNALDHENRTSLFATPLLLRLICNQWFNKANAEGVSFHAYFNPIPLPLMALTFVAIENCIDEWQSESFTALSFSEKVYKTAYQQHLDALEKWQAHLKGGPILAQHQQHLHDQARIHSGAPTLQANPRSHITADDFEASAREAAEHPDSDEDQDDMDAGAVQGADK